jgi:hypothetical protein
MQAASRKKPHANASHRAGGCAPDLAVRISLSRGIAKGIAKGIARDVVARLQNGCDAVGAASGN